MRCCVYRRNSTWSGWQRWSWPVEVEQWPTRPATRPNNTPFDHFFDFITTAPPHRPHGRRQRPCPRHQLWMVVNVSVSLYKTWSPRGTVTGCVTSRCVWRQKTVCFAWNFLHTQRLLKYTEDAQRIYKVGCKWTCYKGFRYTLKLKKPRCIRDSMKFFFSHKVIGPRNSLDQEMVGFVFCFIFIIVTFVAFLCLAKILLV